MLLTVDQPKLAFALATVLRVVTSRSTLPILQNVLLSANNDNTLTVRGTNLAISTSVMVPAAVLEPGTTTLPARLLHDLVRNMPADGAIKLTLAPHNGSVAVESGRFRSTVKAMDASEFPTLPDVSPEAGFELDAAQFTRLVGRTVFATTEDGGRPALSGVNITISGDTLTAAATDGYRLSVVSESVYPRPDLQAIVPASALREAARVVTDVEPVWIGLSQNQAVFKTRGVMIVAQLIEAKFPGYQSLIPTVSTTTVTVNVAQLGNALKVGTLFTDKSNRIALSISDGSLRVQSQEAGTGDSDTELAAETDGRELAIGMNAAYMRDVLAALTTGNVIMRFTDPNRPVLIRPLSVGGDEDMSYTHVIMPMQLGR